MNRNKVTYFINLYIYQYTIFNRPDDICHVTDVDSFYDSTGFQNSFGKKEKKYLLGINSSNRCIKCTYHDLQYRPRWRKSARYNLI